MSDMETAYRIAALAVRQRFAEQHPEDLAVLDRIEAGDVAVYTGSYDHVQEVLRCLNVRAIVDPQDRVQDARIIFVNCSNSYDAARIRQVRSLAEDGKWVVTSDWALGHLIHEAFPGTVR